MKNPFLANIHDFPLLQTSENQKKLIYFDNGATTQKPESVILAIDRYYREENANPHRGAYRLSEVATGAYENARDKVAEFIGAKDVDEIVFTRGATESLNLVAYSYGLSHLSPGDEIVLTILEHHSNLVPWQRVAQKTGAVLKYIYCKADGTITPQMAAEVITDKTKLVAITQMANATGNILPVKEIAALAHENGAVILVDGAQSIPHMQVNVADMDCDFFAFSGHKMFSGMGVGVLYGKYELLDAMPPFLLGGDMIEYVEEQSTTFAPVPSKFEAGTQNVESVVSLSAAIDYYKTLDLPTLEKYERDLMIYAVEKMEALPDLTLYGTHDFEKRGPIISFNIKDIHPHDVATVMDASGICLRSGHHCAQPLMKFLGVQATNRVSFALYNTFDEVDFFVDTLKTVRKWMGYGTE